MKKANKKNNDNWSEWFGNRIRSLIEKKGYKSPYDFWIQECGDDISRATLDNILNGRYDPKISTIRKIARALNISLKTIFDETDL
ncbi:MAG: helix-turn-helix transcriptional regulator [Bacteriovoracaceae bacterium]